MALRLPRLPYAFAILGLLLASALPSAAQVDDDKLDATLVESEIARVLLYSDRAMVMRKGSVAVPAGRSRVAFEGLPEKLRDESVGASLPGRSGKAAKIANIEVEPIYKTTFRDDAAKKANEELKALEREMRVLRDRLKSVQADADFARKIAIGARPTGTPNEVRFLPLAPQSWAMTLDYFAREFQSAAERERKLIEDMDDLKARIVVASARARMLLSYKTRLTKRVILEIAAQRPTRCDVELTYIVSDAAWFPRYDVRADLKQGKVEIVGYALARQESGEDWRDAEIAFSAAEPANAADLPKLASWRIAAAQPVRQVKTEARVSPRKPEMKARKQAANRRTVRSMPSMAHRGRIRKRRVLEQTKQQAAQLRQSLSQVGKAVVSYERQWAAQAPAKQAAVQRELRRLSSSERVAGQIKEIERLNRAQGEALKRKDWQTFDAANKALGQNILFLDPNRRAQFDELLSANAYSLKMARRQLASLKLARGLVAPVRSSGGYDYRWNALRRESVPSDGALTKVVLFRRVFPAQFVYEIAAEKSKMAYLRTKLRNTTRSPFLAGPVSVFLGSDFVGESRLKTCAPTEKFTVGLGADEAIFVERKAIAKRDTRGVFSNVYRFNVKTAITVRNGKGRPVKVAVLERVPYTSDDELKISEGRFDPAPTRTSRVGKRVRLAAWEMDLAPGEKREVTLAYWFQHDADRVVVTREDRGTVW